MKNLLLLLAGALAVGLPLSGCGGGSSGSSGSSHNGLGRASIRVEWPARDRSLPTSSNSLVVSFSQNGRFVKKGVVARPADGGTSTAEFTGLPSGRLDVAMKAYPSSTGTGVPQAEGSDTIDTSGTAPATIDLDLDSRVATLTISPASPKVRAGASMVLSARAKDAGGNTVLLAAGGGQESVEWSVNASGVAELSEPGATVTVTGIARGTATVGASFQTRDDGTMVSATATVSVTGADGTVIVK